MPCNITLWWVNMLKSLFNVRVWLWRCSSPWDGKQTKGSLLFYIIDVALLNRWNQWHYNGKGKIKVKFTLEQTKNVQRGVEVWLYSFFNLGCRCGWVVDTMPRPLYPREKPGAHCVGGWVGHRTGLDGCEKFRPTEIWSPDRLAGSESLYRLRYPDPRHDNDLDIFIRVKKQTLIQFSWKDDTNRTLQIRGREREENTGSSKKWTGFETAIT